MVSHIKRFGFFHADLSSEYIVGCRVVSLKRRGSDRLWMSHFSESSNDGAGFLRTEKDTACFGFRGGSGYTFNGFYHNMEWAIRRRLSRMGIGLVGQSEKVSTSAARVRQNKVSGIRNKAKNHVASMISEDSARMSVKVIQKLVTSGFS